MNSLITPFFSVIIATYNRAALLKRALNSLLRQTETDWEAIIIDDGSTDNTSLEVGFYENERIHYFWQPNKGASEAKNAGIFLSKGKFVTFLDSDDEYAQTHLESRKNILLKRKIDFLHGGVKVIGDNYVPNRFKYRKMIDLSDCEIGETFFIRKNFAQALKGFRDIPLGSDADLLERIMQKNVCIESTNLPTYIYHRETGNSITKDFGIQFHGITA